MTLHSQDRSTLLIAVGLGLVCAAQFDSAWPVATGVALIGLGACLHTQSRWPSVPLLAGVQLVVYSGLAALFIGARLHQMETEPSCFGWLGTGDVFLASGIMLFAVCKTLAPKPRYN